MMYEKITINKRLFFWKSQQFLQNARDTCMVRVELGSGPELVWGGWHAS